MIKETVLNLELNISVIRCLWESLKKRKKDSRLIMLYKDLKGAASISMDYHVRPNRHTGNHHSLEFQTLLTGTDIYPGLICY